MRLLGLSFNYHDAAAALIEDGVVIAAAQEERFSRNKHDPDFPKKAIEFCLEEAGISIDDVEYVVFYEKPILKLERLLQTYIHSWPRGLSSFIYAMNGLFKDKLWVERTIRKQTGYTGPVLYTEHHYSHAASAYYASPFADAVIVTMDGVGEWDTTTIGYGQGNHMTLSKSIRFPHSLGLLYSALTYYLGFKVNSAEYKVMGLAPYGDPSVYMDRMRQLIHLKPDGSFELNMRYFSYEYGFRMTNNAFNVLFDGLPRKSTDPVQQREKDIAAALQKITEEAILHIVRYAMSEHPSKNLCLAGGVALNCVANGRILEEKLCEKIYIQPASGDAGGAVGAALYVYYDTLTHQKKGSAMPNPYLGTEYTDLWIQKFLETDVPAAFGGKRVSYTVVDEHLIAEQVSTLIDGTTVIGWFQGKMEFGPRALGSRSIIADARVKENWQKVNLKIKFRESFRPFAPAVLLEKASQYFKLDGESPSMLLVAPVIRDDIPAVTHVDNSARVQTVKRQDHPRFYDLIRAFDARTECAVIINTSFNIRGEPIVEHPMQALRCFLNTDMDYLVLGNCVLSKKENMHLVDNEAKKRYIAGFDLD
jgi:carbamoyltransferase